MVGANSFLLSFVVCVLFTVHLMLRLLSKSWPQLDRVGAALAALSAALLAIDGLRHLDGVSYRHLQPWSNFPLLGALLGYCWLCLRTGDWLAESGMPLARFPMISCLLLTTVALAGWSWHRLRWNDKLMHFAMDFYTPGQVVEETRFVGVTDTGSRLPLYRLEVTAEEYAKYARDSKERISRLAEPLIVQAEPTSDSNCHGWVFTGGQHLVRSENVDQILCDNGYVEITYPEEDDVIVYRSPTGVVLHTGLVRTVLSDHTVLIESKWGIDGLFLHRPENQPYSQRFAYYRCSRSSHGISVKSTADPTEPPALAMGPTKPSEPQALAVGSVNLKH